MRPEVFEALSPLCPRCLHGDRRASPLVIAEAAETRDGQLWHGILHCSENACWTEFPVIDGVPIIVADPRGFLQGARAHLLARDDLPPVLAGLVGDALGAGEYDTTRQHLSIYCDAHYGDWVVGHPSDKASDDVPGIVHLIDTGIDCLGSVEGAALDLGGAVGRGGWELAARGLGPVLVGDMNLSFLRLAQRLMLEGEAVFGRRRTGLVYDVVRIALPSAASASAEAVDFWAIDAMALPFGAAAFGFATAINLVDSIAGPSELVAEMARVLAPGAGAVFTTPYDWSANAAEPARWMGGHSQRGPLRGAGEPVLDATLRREGLTPVAERDDLPWTLRLHARARMRYALHLVACRRDAT